MVSAEVGINTKTPNSTLTVNGSVRARYTEVISANYNILSTDYYITYNDNTDATFTLPAIGSEKESFTGRIYKIKNTSPNFIILQTSNGNTLREDKTQVKTLAIPTGAFVEIVNNSNTSGGTWDVSFFAPSSTFNVEAYAVNLKIPPHAKSGGDSLEGEPDWENHSNTKYDTGKGNDSWV